jgi:hypothetical protein
MGGKNYYFGIMNGLRGCYMPDSEPYVVKITTRKALKAVIAGEAESLRQAEYYGLCQKSVARFIADCWKRRNDRTWNLDLALPCSQRRGGSEYGLFVSRSNRDEYKACEESQIW